MRTTLLLLALALLVVHVSSFAHDEYPSLHRRAETTDPEELMEEQDTFDDKTAPPVITRECELKSDSDKVTLGCKAETSNEHASTEMQDEIDFTVQASYKGAGVLVEYKQEIDSQQLESETETSFEIWFDRIIEYAKANGDASSEAFDWQEDTIVKTLYLLEWNDFTEVQTDGMISHFSVSTPQGVATFNFTISRGDKSTTLSANKMKIDFWMRDLTLWKERQDTYVALLSKVESERNVELDYDDGNHAVESIMPSNALISFAQQQTSGGGIVDNDDVIPFGEFSWQTTAQAIDDTTVETANGTVAVERSAQLGTTIQVVATSPPVLGERQPGDKSSEYIAFSFVGEGSRSASEIYWDPQAGIRYGTEASATSGAGVARFVSTLSVVVGSLVGALVLVVF